MSEKAPNNNIAGLEALLTANEPVRAPRRRKKEQTPTVHDLLGDPPVIHSPVEAPLSPQLQRVEALGIPVASVLTPLEVATQLAGDLTAEVQGLRAQLTSTETALEVQRTYAASTRESAVAWEAYANALVTELGQMRQLAHDWYQAAIQAGATDTRPIPEDLKEDARVLELSTLARQRHARAMERSESV